MSKPRTRFAPSPTGYMHVGNLRTALYAYLIAKKSDGSFILRIEDTDRERYVEGADAVIFKTLRETGLFWNEGPDVGGDYGPYVQSERRSSYMEYAKKLVESGAAYYCFCSKERLDEMRARQHAANQNERYDGLCASLTKEEVEKRLAAGESFVIRQRMPKDGVTAFDDLVYGHIEIDNSELEDQVLIKADGMPTYNFANVVDDHLMAITHVIRGNEYLTSTPKYNLLYQAFGFDIPQYIHCPPVMKNATEKLSKRNGDASYQDLVAKGYLTEAILNYLALLGWSPKGERELYTLEELVEEFDVSGISKSPSIFDPEKLKYINGEYIRRLTPEQFVEKALPYIEPYVKRPIDISVLCHALQPRTEVLSEIPEKLTFIDEMPDYDISLYENKKMKTDAAISLDSLKTVLPVLEALDDFTAENIHAALFELIERLGCKNGVILYPLRVALSGLPMTPGGGVELSAMFGKTETLARINAAIEKLSR